MGYFIGALTAIAIYSTILTASLIYKSNSSYFIESTLDVILAGPVAWILILIAYCIRPIYQLWYKHRPEKRTIYKRKDQKYIDKIVKKIVKNYSKKKYHNDYFDFNLFHGYGNCNDIEGFDKLLVKKVKNEHVNNRFLSLMFHQKEDTISALMEYFELVTEDRFRSDGFHDLFIKNNKDKPIFVLKHEYL